MRLVKIAFNLLPPGFYVHNILSSHSVSGALDTGSQTFHLSKLLRPVQARSYRIIELSASVRIDNPGSCKDKLQHPAALRLQRWPSDDCNQTTESEDET